MHARSDMALNEDVSSGIAAGLLELGEALHESAGVAAVGVEGKLVVEPGPLPPARTTFNNLDVVVSNVTILDGNVFVLVFRHGKLKSQTALHVYLQR
jgi:hypothetical protein